MPRRDERLRTACVPAFGILLLCAGCPTVSTDNQPVTAPESSASSTAATDECSHYVELSDGRLICVDTLVAVLLASGALDQDGDGVPNRLDPDVDGDEIPNKLDVDVDGDGEPNSVDDDVDGDGAPNILDADIDGDLLRNDWDLDMDGDGAINSLDDDADGDGRRKRRPARPKGDPEEPDDPEKKDKDCDSKDPDGSKDCPPKTQETTAPPHPDDIHDDSPEEVEQDRGPQQIPAELVLPDVPTDPIEPADPNDPPAHDFEWLLADPLPSERRAVAQDIAVLLDKPAAEVREIIDEIVEADPQAEPAEVLDAVVNQLEAAVERNPADDDGRDPVIDWPAVPTHAVEEFDERITTVRRIAVAEADPRIGELTAATNQIFDRVKPADRPVAVEVALEVSRVVEQPDVNDCVETSLDLIEIAAEHDTPVDELPAVVPTLDATARELVTADDAIEVAWQIVAELHRDFESSEGATFSPLALLKAVEAIAQASDGGTVVEVTESSRNVATAAAAHGLSEPVKVVQAVERAGGDPADGIDPAEAEAAAAIVKDDESA